MNTSVIGYPRIGKDRELKFASEKFFRGEIEEAELLAVAKEIRRSDLLKQKEEGITYISSNDFSFYDNVLDAAFLFGIVPQRYKELGLSDLGTYFAMARGYQGDKGNVKALAMKKWFNTNYHYLVPEIDDDTVISLTGTKPVDEFVEAKEFGVNTKTAIVGPFTFLKLARFTGAKKISDVAGQLTSEYVKLVSALADKGLELIEFDEPYLVRDLTGEDIELFRNIYNEILANKNGVKVLLQTYFGDIRDIYKDVTALDFDAIGLDFIEGKKTLELVSGSGFPADKTLFAGVVNGKNIWRNDYSKSLELLKKTGVSDVVVSTSCSLLHVPYTLASETKLGEEYTRHLAFAEEKLGELKDIAALAGTDYANEDAFKNNQALFSGIVNSEDKEVQAAVAAIKIVNGAQDTSASAASPTVLVAMNTSTLAQPMFETVEDTEAFVDPSAAFYSRNRGLNTLFSWMEDGSEQYALDASFGAGGNEGFDVIAYGEKLYGVVSLARTSEFALRDVTGAEQVASGGSAEEAVSHQFRAYALRKDGNLCGIYVWNAGHSARYYTINLSGVESVAGSNAVEVASTYYNLQGVRIDNPSAGQIYIRVATLSDGSVRTSKVVVR